MPEVDIQVADFALDTFPVTVGRFRKFVEVYGTLSLLTGAGADPNVPGSGWHTQFSLSLLPSAEALRASLLCGTTSSPGLATWTDVPGSNENKPINCVSWYDAFAFCIWDGGWLPTDAAWEYAAAGGAEDRRFPWGQPDADPTRVPSTCAYSGMACDAATLPEVGAFPAGSGKWGHLDLTGGFSQWTQDADHYYVKPKFGLGTGGCFTGQTDCFYPPSGQGAVVRGGGPLPDKVLHAFDRQSIPVNATFPWLGLRCAR
jgi:formylglycine-generating enzyme required for sulfatase activity